MSIITVIIIIVSLLVVLFTFSKIKRSKDSGKLNYVKKRSFMSPAEKLFFSALRHVVEDEYFIFPQVQVASLLTPKKDLHSRHRKALCDDIRMLHISFVICHQSDLSVVAAITLNPFTARGQEKDKHTRVLNDIFQGTGMTLVHFEADKTYSYSDIKKCLAPCFKNKPTTYTPLVTQSDESFDFDVIQFDDDSDTEPVDEEDLTMNTQMQVLCPKCSSVMFLREANKGRRAGKKFWMCSAYPKCKRAIPADDMPRVI